MSERDVVRYNGEIVNIYQYYQRFDDNMWLEYLQRTGENRALRSSLKAMWKRKDNKALEKLSNTEEDIRCLLFVKDETSFRKELRIVFLLMAITTIIVVIIIAPGGGRCLL